MALLRRSQHSCAVSLRSAVTLLHKVQKLYCVEVISYTIMANHWHAVIHVPSELPSVEEMVRRYNEYYEGKRQIDATSHEIEEIRARLIDFSCMIGTPASFAA